MPKTLREEFPSVLDIAYSDYQKHMHVSEIMSPNVKMIEKDATMLDAARIMGEHHIGSLLVDGWDRPSGIITERDLLTHVIAQNRDPKKVKVYEIMSPRLITIRPHENIRDSAKTMIREKGRLVVMEGRKLLGIVTASDLVKSLPQVPETSVPLRKFMTREVTFTTPDQKVIDAAKTMGKERIGSLIVKKEGKPWGIFTERDLLTKVIYKGQSLSRSVSDFCSSPLIRIELSASIHKAAKIMTEHHIRRLPVSDNEELSGIITARDLVEAYAI